MPPFISLGPEECVFPFFQECGLAREKAEERRAVESSLNHQIPFQLTDWLIVSVYFQKKESCKGSFYTAHGDSLASKIFCLFITLENKAIW